MDARPALLDELTRRLEGLLSGFEGEALPAARLDGLWRACADSFERFRAANEARPDEPLPADARARLEQALRLSAVAASLAARSQDELRSELDKIVQVRARLASRASGPELGEACDLVG